MDSAVSSGERGTRSFTGTGTGRDGLTCACGDHLHLWDAAMSEMQIWVRTENSCRELPSFWKEILDIALTIFIFSDGLLILCVPYSLVSALLQEVLSDFPQHLAELDALLFCNHFRLWEKRAIWISLWRRKSCRHCPQKQEHQILSTFIILMYALY